MFPYGGRTAIIHSYHTIPHHHHLKSYRFSVQKIEGLLKINSKENIVLAFTIPLQKYPDNSSKYINENDKCYK